MNEAFEKAVARALSEKGPGGIGTLSEKTLHRALKYWYEPDEGKHEIPFGSFFADIRSDEGVTEIQTGSFFHLNKKLAELLKTERVTLVCPVVRRRRVIWTDPSTGEIKKPRLSPKKGRLEDVFLELVHILPRLREGDLLICVPLVDADDYRIKRPPRRKYHDKGFDKLDLVPTELVSETVFVTKEDWLRLLPDMPEGFTAGELAKALSLPAGTAQAMLRTLAALGALTRERRERTFHYFREEP